MIKIGLKEHSECKEAYTYIYIASLKWDSQMPL